MWLLAPGGWRAFKAAVHVPSWCWLAEILFQETRARATAAEVCESLTAAYIVTKSKTIFIRVCVHCLDVLALQIVSACDRVVEVARVGVRSTANPSA